MSTPPSPAEIGRAISYLDKNLPRLMQWVRFIRDAFRGKR